MVISIICNIIYVCRNNLSIIVFLFCNDSIADSTMHIMVYLYYLLYKDNIWL